jgi:acid phosphatase type 7
VKRFSFLSGINRRTFLRVAAGASAGSVLIPNGLQGAAHPFLRDPNVQNVSAAGASVVWALLSAVTGAVEVADSSGNASMVPATVTEFDRSQTGMPHSYFQYEAAIGNLTPGTSYSYRIHLNGKPAPLACPLQFTTPDNAGFSFLHLADSGEGNQAQFQIGEQMAQENVSLVLANGDLAYDLATYASVEANYYRAYRTMMARMPFFTSLGNHEYYTGSGAPSLAGRVTPASGVCAADQGRYYSFDWGNVHFVVLDSNQPLVDAIAGTGQMLEWLDNDLSATRQFWRIAMFHHPGYATGVHQSEPPAGQVRQYIVPILEKYGVQLVFNGHEHTYQRTYELLEGQTITPNSGGIVYITSGGGGAGPYWTAPNNLIAESIGVNHYVRGNVSGSTIQLGARALGADSDMDSALLAPEPQIFSVQNPGSMTTNLASGGQLTVLGRNLCPTQVQASAQAPVLEAAGCSVTINGVPIPLYYADAGQLNAQIPSGLAGAATLMVVTPNGTAQTSINVSALTPQISPKRFNHPETVRVKA